MYCENCGNKLNQESKFCSNCGDKLKKIFDKKEETLVKPTDDKVSNDKPSSIFSKATSSIVSVLGFFMVIVIAKALGKALGFGAVFLFGSIWIGTIFSKWRAKKQQGQNNVIMGWIGWSNLVTWIFPFLGLFTSAATVSFSKYPQDVEKKFKIIGWISLCVSFLNGAVGIVYELSKL